MIAPADQVDAERQGAVAQHGVDAEDGKRDQRDREAQIEGVHDAAVFPGRPVDTEHQVGEQVGHGDYRDCPEEPVPGFAGDVSVEPKEKAGGVAGHDDDEVDGQSREGANGELELA